MMKKFKELNQNEYDVCAKLGYQILKQEKLNLLFGNTPSLKKIIENP